MDIVLIIVTILCGIFVLLAISSPILAKFTNKYDEWEYLIECCGLYGADDVIWFNDWYEGHQDVEYLGVAVIDVP